MAVKRWVTEQMQQLLGDRMCYVLELRRATDPACSVTIRMWPREGDESQAIAVRGYVTGGKVVPDMHHCSVEHVEVTGQGTSDPDMARVRTHIVSMLTRMGFDVTPTMLTNEQNSTGSSQPPAEL